MDIQSVGYLFIAAGLLWFVAFVTIYVRASRKAKAALDWPSTIGQVVSSDVQVRKRRRDRRDVTEYHPIVVYSYTAAGRELTCSRLRYGGWNTGSKGRAEAVTARYPVGSSPTVRYNPENPEDAVLETGKASPVYLVMAPFGLIFLLVGLAFSAVS